MNTTPEKEHVRKDKGRITLTLRDFRVLTWIGEQYAVRLDQLEILLGREAQRETQQVGKVGTTTAQRVVNRWLTAGFARSKYLLAHEPVWVYLTHKGLREVGLALREHTPTAGMANHHYWTNQVRLDLEKHYPADLWVSERYLVKQAGEQEKENIHHADAEIHRSDEDDESTIIAVEVELTVKARHRSRQIMEELAGRYDGVWYYTTPATHEAVQRTIADLPQEVRAKFRVRDLATTK